MNLIFLITLIVPLIGWQLFNSSLNDWEITNDGWITSGGSTGVSIQTCPNNQMQLLCLDESIPWAQKSITGLPPHYQVKVVADLYYIGSYDNEYGELSLDSVSILKNTINYQQTSYYNNLCDLNKEWTQLQIKTAVSQLTHNSPNVDLQISTNLNEAFSNEGFCIRNVQLLINPCHYSCLTCNGGLMENCLSCRDGLIPASGQCPRCTDPNLSFQTLLAGCVEECERMNYLADEKKFCQFNNRVSQQSSSFILNTFPTSYDWDLYNIDGKQQQKQFRCDGQIFTGPYGIGEQIKKSDSFGDATKQIRIRISHLIFGVQNQYSQLELLMDGVFVSLIYMKDGMFKTINNTVTKNITKTCSNSDIYKSYNVFRTEQIIKITNLNPTFTLKSSSNFWSVRYIYVDIIVCSLYCSNCLDDQNCSICEASYHLYKGQCISTCPEYSTVSGVNCIDFDEETQYTSYLIKAFYSFDSQDTETSLFNLFSSAGTNFQKGESIYFSYLNDRRIFGGALVWLNAKFGNTYSIPQPHYAVRVRMVVILGDDFGNGQFQYQFESDPIVTLTSSTYTSHSQQWGDIQDEYSYQVNTLVSHTASSFSITVECIGDTSKAINQAFCGISNYFVTVLECPTFCDACTDISTCSSWSTAAPNFDPITHSCFPGYSTNISSKTCVADPVCGNGILELNEECDDGNQIQADGCFNCQYQCSSYYTSCVNLYQNSCEFGYYLNQFDNICYPKCGDGIIVPEEQCEDGNILPFDGCHRCMFSCQDACSECRNGKCYKCKIGWSLQNGKCQPICGDGIVRGFEICDDANSYQIVDTCQSNICSYICPNNCQSCTLGVCYQCDGGFKLNTLVNKCETVCGDLNITQFEECDDGNLVPYDGCHQCMFQCQNSCSDCRFGKCYKCKSGWEWKSQTFRCEPICGDGLRAEIEVCDDRIYQLGDVCLACQFGCPNNCIACDYGVCKVCDTGYQLDKIRNNCQPICGDNLAVLNEDCDDGNLIPDDGCHECSFSCQDVCEHCQKGQCLQCKQGWILNDANFTCFTICGDGETAGLEFCDDGNDILLDGCYDCHFQCQLKFIICEEIKCHLTESIILATHDCATFESCDSKLGMYLDQLANQCKPYCGDKIKAFDEECDDGNLVPYDGCDKCLFSCDPLCIECNLGVCGQCQKGYEVIQQKCKGICGDGIQLTDSEDCDDFNTIPRDGCTACKIDPNYVCILTEMGPSVCYTCPNNCLICDQFECKQCKPSYFMNQGLCQSCGKQCEECEGTPNNCTSCLFEGCKLCESRPGYYTNFEDKSCYQICGDNVVSEGEQCDDGNQDSNDGCDSLCQSEGRFKCGDAGCTEIPLPTITLEYKNTTTTDNLLFQINSPINIGYCENIKISIEQFQEIDYNVTTSEDVLKNSCEFIFLFKKTIEEVNLIHMLVPIIDDERRLLSSDTREVIIKPRRKVYYSESQIAQAKSVVAASESLSLILKLIGPLTIVLGGFNFFWTILDIMTWINNFYFINVDYPENVRMLFHQLEWGDIFMIPTVISLNSEQDEYYFEAPPKFVEKDVDPLFANNIQLFLCLVGISFIVYLLSRCILNCLNKCYKVQKRSKNVAFYDLFNNKSFNQQVELFNQPQVPIYIKKLKKECQYFKNNYRAILMQIMGLVFLDLCLASILQLTNTSTQQYWIVKANIIIAWLNLILIGYIFYLYSKVCNSHETLLKNKTYVSIFGSMYEGINIKSNISKTYAFVNLVRKSLFIFFIVYYYDDPILQTSTCCGACFLNIALLCYNNPFKSVQLFIKNGLPDVCIFFILLITVGLAVDDVITTLTHETKFILGWIILSFIGISIMTQLIFLLQVFYQNFKTRVKLIKNLICPAAED